MKKNQKTNRPWHAFQKMCVENPRQRKAAKKFYDFIVHSIANDLLFSGEYEIRVGKKAIPDGKFCFDYDEAFAKAIMTAKPGTQVKLLRDGEEYEDYDHAPEAWQVRKGETVYNKIKSKK